MLIIKKKKKGGMLMNFKLKKISNTNFLFIVSYALFTFSLFNRDVSDTEILSFMTVPAKYAALVILTCSIMYKAYTKRQIQYMIILLCMDIIIMLKSGVLTFILITLFAFYSIKIENKTIVKTAFFTMVLYTMVVILFCMIGIYQDVITNRWIESSNRHSFGFYHSNVLPLAYSYLVGYGLLSGYIKKKQYLLIVIFDFIIYYFCGSRNALVLTLMLIIGKIFADSRFANGKYKGIINLLTGFLAKFIVPILTAISVGVPLLMDRFHFFHFFDYIVSYRFTFTAKLIESEGIHFVASMTNKMFFSNEIVVDNGYAFLTIRYGLLIIGVISLLVYCLGKRYKNDTFVLITIVIVACGNFIDNDIIDYSCLPYLIIAEKCFIQGVKGRSKLYGRSYKCNNEYI